MKICRIGMKIWSTFVLVAKSRRRGDISNCLKVIVRNAWHFTIRCVWCLRLVCVVIGTALLRCTHIEILIRDSLIRAKVWPRNVKCICISLKLTDFVVLKGEPWWFAGRRPPRTGRSSIKDGLAAESTSKCYGKLNYGQTNKRPRFKMDSLNLYHHFICHLISFWQYISIKYIILVFLESLET